MKRAVLFFCCVSLAGAAELTEDRTVYLLPMGHSLDQFLANCLTRGHVLQVVTDPAKADTIITDRVGSALEEQLKDLYPPPEAKETAKKKEDNSKAKEETAKTQEGQPSQSASPPIFGDTANKVEKAGYMATSGRGRGTIFLVDVKSRQVIWSLFDPPKNNSPRELDRTAERIVKRLKVDLAGK
jgi:hypothetical protein